jgi:murein L,D-transpeptidase YafK
MSSNTKRKVSHYLLVLFVCFLAGMTNARTQTEPRNLKILKEHKDANGNTVRTIQYYQGSARVVETRIINQFKSLNAPIDPDTLDKDQLMVVITKSRFLLDVYYRRKKIRSYKVVFGPKPQENKMMKGDRRTPEGWYKVQEKHASARYHKFIHIDYPNDSARKRFEILKRQGAVPPNADIGGDVGIHGVWPGGETTIDMGMGWTDGCIAMKNTDVDDLYKILDTGVRILIRK